MDEYFLYTTRARLDRHQCRIRPLPVHDATETSARFDRHQS